MTDPENLDPRQAICEDLDISLYGRFTESNVCDKLGFSLATLRRMRARGEIGYLKTGRKISFFGYQLCDFLLASVTIQESIPCPDTADRQKPTRLETTGSDSATAARLVPNVVGHNLKTHKES